MKWPIEVNLSQFDRRLLGSEYDRLGVVIPCETSILFLEEWPWAN